MSVFDGFSVNANPLSAPPWTNAQNVAGKTKPKAVASISAAVSQAVGPGPDDSYAYILGSGNAVVEFTLHRDAALADGDGNSYEVEVLLFVTDDAGNTVCIEVDMFFHNGDPVIARWFGAGSFSVLTGDVQDAAGWPDGASGQLRHGYKIKVALEAGQINIYCDSGSGYVLYRHYVPGADATNDNPPLSTGDAGIGFFSPSSTSNPLLFGMQDATITFTAAGSFPPVPEAALMHDRLNTLSRM